MKRYLPLLLIVGAIGAVWYWFSRPRKSDALQAHQAELDTNAGIGRLAQMAINYIRPPVQTLSSRGPLDGAVTNLLDLATGNAIPQDNTPTWRPTFDGYSATDPD